MQAKKGGEDEEKRKCVDVLESGKKRGGKRALPYIPLLHLLSKKGRRLVVRAMNNRRGKGRKREGDRKRSSPIDLSGATNP